LLIRRSFASLTTVLLLLSFYTPLHADDVLAYGTTVEPSTGYGHASGAPVFDGPEEFLEAMRWADIARKHKNLVYVQALKWMQAASGQAGGRKQVSNPRPVQGGRRQEARRARSSRKSRPPARGNS